MAWTPDNVERGHRLVGYIVWIVALTLPAVASAELYKYEKPDGSVLITTERRPDLELKEVVGDDSDDSESTGSSTGRARSNRSSDSSSGEEESSASSATTRAASATDAERSRPESFQEAFQGDREDRFDDIVREASRAYDVPFSFIKAVIRVESNFRPDVTSHAGAMGLMQLMPKTAEGLSVTKPYDPRQNIFGGTKLLRQLIDRYDGDINLILSAYNAGGAAVETYNGIPYRKTRRYVASVYKWYKEYSEAYASDSNDDTEEAE